MEPRARRRVWSVVLAVIAVGAAGLAWWFRPPVSVDGAAFGGADADWPYPPVDGVRAPTPRPLDAPERGPDPEDASDTGAGDEARGAAGGGPDAPEDTDDAAPPEEVDGASVLPSGWEADRLVGAFPPGNGQLVDLLLTPDGRMFAQAERADGSVVLEVDLTRDGPPRTVNLEGVGEPALAAARARSPRWTGSDVVVLAEDGSGRTRVWTVDADGLGTPLDDEGRLGQRLDHLDAAGGYVVATTPEGGVVWREGTGPWTPTAPGPAGLRAVSVSAGADGPDIALLRNDRLSVLTPDRTVPEALFVGSVGDVVRLDGATAWVAGGEITHQPDEGERAPLDVAPRALAGPDVVRSTGRSQVLAWVRPDGELATWPPTRQDARPVVPVARVLAHALLVTQDGTRIHAIAGREGAVADVVLVEGSTGARIR